MSVLKYIDSTDNFKNSITGNKFPIYNGITNEIDGKFREVFYSIPPKKTNLPVLLWFNTDPKKLCFYKTEWWLNKENFDTCNSAKHSKNGGYWLLDMYKKIEEDVIIICMNPSSQDNWDFNESTWPQSNTNHFGYPGPTYDQDFIQQVIKYFFVNNHNTQVDADNVFFGGWSVGCQMVSRMFQTVKTENTLDPIENIRGGIMLSGGTYNCYEGFGSGIPIGNCKDCNNTCDGNTPECCAFCCPKDTTEAYYNSKEKYKDHPLCFLSQQTDNDNAAINAAKNYYCTLQKNIQTQNFICVKQEYEISPNSITADTNYMVHLNSKLPSNYCQPTLENWKSFEYHWDCDAHMCFDKRLVYPVRNFIYVNSSTIGIYNKLNNLYNYKNENYNTELMIALSIGIGIPFVILLIFILRYRLK